MIKEPRAMAEIHRIREQLHEKWREMDNEEEILESIHQASQRLIKQYQLKLKKVERKDIISVS